MLEEGEVVGEEEAMVGDEDIAERGGRVRGGRGGW